MSRFVSKVNVFVMIGIANEAASVIFKHVQSILILKLSGRERKKVLTPKHCIIP